MGCASALHRALSFKRSLEVSAGILCASMVLVLYVWFNQDNSLGRLATSYQGSWLKSAQGDSLLDEEPQLPKVALMFLTHGAMPLRHIWRAFLEAAAVIPDQATQQGAAGQQQRPQQGWQVLFSLYTHPPPGFSYLQSNLFAGSEVPGRVAVQWGQSTMVVAERALLRAALADPLNQRFMQLSESCIPLFPPATIYWQLMSETRSRMNWCLMDPDMYRWQPELEGFNLTKSEWRKSSQWKMLIRKHAELVAGDDVVITGFHKLCYGDRAPPKFCVPGEHYMPTLLVHLGLETEVDCRAKVTHTQFGGHQSHPRTYEPGEATQETLAHLRGECSSLDGQDDLAKRSIREALWLVNQQPPGASPAAARSGGGGSSAAEGGMRALIQANATLNITSLPSGCPLFARKVSGEGASQWLNLLRPILMA